MRAMNLFAKERLRYSRKLDIKGYFSTVAKPLVFSWCLKLCDDMRHYKTKKPKVGEIYP
jgi:hypothetical protein